MRAEPRPCRRRIGGIAFDDPYAWLEEDSAEVLAWQRAQSAACDRYLEGIDFDSLRDAIAPHTREALTFAPQHFGEHWFTLAPSAAGFTLTVSASPRTPGRTLIDLSAFAPADQTASLDFFFPSPAGTYVAFGISTCGDEQSTLRVAETATGALHVIAVPFASNCYVSWLPDETGFFLSAGLKSDFDDVTKYLFFHAIGERTRRVPEPVATREQYSIKPQVSADGRYVVALASEMFPRPDFIKHMTGGDWRPFLVDVEAQITGHFVGDNYVAVTTLQAPRGRLVSIPIATASDPSTWKELIPQSSRVMRTLERVQDYLVLCEYEDSFARLKVLNLDGTLYDELTLPGDGGVRQSGLATHYQLIGYGGDNICAGNGDFTFVFSTFTRSPAVYRYAIASRTLEQLTAPRFDLAHVTASRQIAMARDGREARYFVIHRKDLDTKQPQPALMYGYGGFNVSFIPGYLGAFIPFIEAGGILVFAQLRGGNEFGIDQWLDGRLATKQHTFDDVYAIAESLIARGVTTSDKLAMVGSSGGGMLTGTVAVQRPDLFHAVCSMVPLYDMMTFTRDPYAALVGLDVGDPATSEAAGWLYRWSPYHNVRDAAYAAMLIVTAANDMRCRPWHARKLAARLATSNLGKHPILLKVLEGEGHFGGFLDAHRAAVWMGFLMRELGMEPVAGT